MVTGGFRKTVTNKFSNSDSRSDSHPTLALRNTFFVNVQTGLKVEGPLLNIERFNHGCEKVVIDGQPLIFVVGGETKQRKRELHLTQSVEYLELSNLNDGWKKATDLPFALGGPKLVTSMDKSSLYVLGGVILASSDPKEMNKKEDPMDFFADKIDEMMSKNPRWTRFIYKKKINMGILQLKCQTMENCKWHVLEKRPTYPRVNGVAIAIPDSLADSLCSKSRVPNLLDDFWINLKESMGNQNALVKGFEKPLEFLENFSKLILKDG